MASDGRSVPSTRPGWLPVIAGALAFLLVLVLAALLRLVNPGDSPAPAVSRPSQGAKPVAAPPAAEVQRVHKVLHDMYTQCQARTGAGRLQTIDRDVDLVLAFARRYPEARFAMDDESGTALSLLLATREDLRSCAPAAAARVTQALPERFR